MGKGDKRTRRGKIFAGTFGKTRPKRKAAAEKPAVQEEVKPARRTRKQAAPAE
jgi:30S ribosomal protein S31